MANDESSETGGSKSGKENNDEEETSDKVTFRNCPEFRKDFIQLCLEEVNDAGYMGSSLKAQSWEKMGKKLSEKFKCPMPYKKLRNHWDYLKKQYMVWSKLISMTGHGYNVETNKFDWPEEQWNEISKKVKNASQFKEKGLEDADILRDIFEGKFPSGGIKWTPGHPRKTTNINDAQIAGTSATNTVPSEELEQSIPHVDLDPSIQDDVQDSSASKLPDKEKKRKRVEASSSDAMNEKVDYLVEAIDKHLQHKQIFLEKSEGVATQFIKSLDDLKDAGHITFDESLEVGFKASELSGWQKLFINLPTIEHQVSYVNKLLGKR